jgi:hypothetical protein
VFKTQVSKFSEIIILHTFNNVPVKAEKKRDKIFVYISPNVKVEMPTKTRISVWLSPVDCLH